MKLATLPFGVHSTFDGSMILFEDIIQVLHGSVSTTMAQSPFLLTVGDRGAVDRRQVGVDHSRLWMGWIARLTAIVEPDGSLNITATPTLETDYTYDPLNNLTRVSPGSS